MKWISVKDRLPVSALETVLTCNDEGHVQSARYCEDQWEQWTTPYRDINNITHWMPLPDLPEDI